jgi:WD40 repeat protein
MISRVRVCFSFSYFKKTGECLRIFQIHDKPVSSCAWLPDGERFVTGGMEPEIILMSVDGSVLHRWSGSRVYGLAPTPDGGKLVSISTDNKLQVHDLLTRSLEASIPMPSDLTCVSVSKDSQFALVNIATSVSQ